MAVRQILQGETLGGIAQQAGASVQDILKLNPAITDPNVIQAGASLNMPEKPIVASVVQPAGGAITFNTQNPALQTLVNQANQKVSELKMKGGELSPEANEAINRINTFETNKLSTLAQAREGADAKDVSLLNESLNKVSDIEAEQKASVDKVLEELLKPLKPFTKKITETRRVLNTLRTERKLLPLELRKEGISAEGIASRQIDDERLRAIQEANLLAEIGLLQEAKKDQLSFIDLRFKVEDRIIKQEQNVIDRAQKLSIGSLNMLQDVVSSFSGLNWEDLDADTQADVLTMIKPFSDLNASLVADALKNAKQQQIFKRSKDKETKATLSPDKRTKLAGAGFTPTEISDIERSVNQFGIKATLKAVDNENQRRIVAEQYGAEEILDEVETEIEEAKPKTETKKWWQFWK